MAIGWEIERNTAFLCISALQEKTRVGEREDKDDDVGNRNDMRVAGGRDTNEEERRERGG